MNKTYLIIGVVLILGAMAGLWWKNHGQTLTADSTQPGAVQQAQPSTPQQPAPDPYSNFTAPPAK